MSIKKGLGRGIESLMGNYDAFANFETEKLKETGAKIIEIDISNIKANPNQPRKVFDVEKLNELAQSIAAQGIIQPLLVEEISENSYVIIAGERRYRASKLAGLSKVPCIVREFSDLQRMEVSLIENIQRESLNPVEEARAYSYLISQSGIKQEELAKRVGKSRPAIANSIRLLNLAPNMLDSLEKGDFTSGHARALLSVENPAEREILYSEIISKGLSVRQSEELASNLNNGIRAINTNRVLIKQKKIKTEEIMEIEEKFLSASGCKVEIKGKLNKGKVVIPFNNTDELERIYQFLDPNGYLFDNEEEVKF